jgi:hypothetical protein
MCETENIYDHMAYTCECGSVNFALLRSGNIECNYCGKIQDGRHNIDDKE